MSDLLSVRFIDNASGDETLRQVRMVLTNKQTPNIITLVDGDNERHSTDISTGVLYVMNSVGKTIATYGKRLDGKPPIAIEDQHASTWPVIPDDLDAKSTGPVG